jgi:hypothetical protein
MNCVILPPDSAREQGMVKENGCQPITSKKIENEMAVDHFQLWNEKNKMAVNQ